MKLGYIGIGLMGKPMVLRLLAAGYGVTVWNRSREKLAPVVEKGAMQAATPAELAAAVDLAMMCVTDQAAAEEVLFGKHGVAAGARAGLIVVDFSSIAPAAAVSLSARLEKQGVALVDAPVSGGVPGAEKGTLAVMAGGPAGAIERVRPVVAHLAQRFTRMGDSGAGQATKLCNQVIVAALMAVIAEAVRLAEGAGVDATKLPEALKGGFADSLPLQIFGARMAARTFEPSLGAGRLMLKDLSNALDFAAARGVPLPMGAAAREMYRLLESQGKIDREISALVTAYESRRDQ
ncbi:MAG TPA: NAD(P)-dependent oxidoreductase [Burkholderiales bacterium]|nr:NAD(P)-dependent oxidoreductase [Burkholderiales bacterium]